MDPVSAKNRVGSLRIDTERVAALLVRWYGPQAANRARLRAQDRKKSDDMSGYAVWLAVERAIRRRVRAAVDLAALSTAA